MSEQQMTAPLTPLPQRRFETLDAMISQIDTDSRLRREGEKRPHASIPDEGACMPILTDESFQIPKRQCLSLDLASIVSDDEGDCSSPPRISYRQQWRRTHPAPSMKSISCTLRPRNLNLELSPYSSPFETVHRIENDLPMMPF